MGAGVIGTLRGGGMSGSLVRGAPETQKFLQDRGATLTGAQTTRAVGVQTAEGLASSGIGGASVIQQTQTQAKNVVQDTIDNLVSRFKKAPGDEASGAILKDIVEGGTETFRSNGRSLYGEVDSLAQDSFVDATKLVERAKIFSKKKSISKGEKEVADSVLEVLEGKDFLTFSQASELRSDLLAIGRHGTELIKGRSQGAGKVLAHDLNTAMEATAKELGQDAKMAWHRANTFWKEGRATFGDKVIKKAASQSPEALFVALKNAEPLSVKRVRDLSIPSEWRQLQSQYVNDLTQSAALPDGKLSGASLATKLNRIGDETLKEWFPRGEGEQFKKLANHLRIAEASGSAGKFGITMQILQAGAASGVVLGFASSDPATISGGSIALLLTPTIVARILAKPSTVDAIIKASSGKTTVKGMLPAPVRQAIYLLTREGAQVMDRNISPAIKRDLDAIEAR